MFFKSVEAAAADAAAGRSEMGALNLRKRDHGPAVEWTIADGVEPTHWFGENCFAARPSRAGRIIAAG